jgi:prevent-host-death family protein
LVNYVIMMRINIADVKAHFSRYLERVERGETIVICRRNVPIAEIRPVAKLPQKLRPVGIDRGMTVPPSFFEPLPGDLLDAFEGRDESK